MRPISSKEELEKKKKRKTFLISFLMFLILVIGTAGYAFLSSTDNPSTDGEYKEGEARFNGNRWVLAIDGKDFYFLNSPESTGNVSVVVSSSLADYNGLPMYIVSDNNAVSSEIALTLGTYASRVQGACYGPCDKDLPEKDCSENLIIWKDNSENKVYQKQNCVFIEGDTIAVDAFLYHVLGIK
jgi:hypothetical protein